MVFFPVNRPRTQTIVDIDLWGCVICGFRVILLNYTPENYRLVHLEITQLLEIRFKSSLHHPNHLPMTIGLQMLPPPPKLNIETARPWKVTETQ